LDQQGAPWVTWSAYDGIDYEIFASSWGRSAWQKAETITNNHEAADAEPSASLYLKSIPIISWTQSLGGKRDIFLTFKQDNAWAPPVNISRDDRRSAASVLICEDDKILLSWKDSDEKKIYLQSLPAPAVMATWHQLGHAPLELNIPPPLQPHKFTGFGDSITYGWENGPTPENGYVPRLQWLLKALFANPVVTNRGIPGEPTWDALSRITQVIAADKSQYLLLMEGTNDVSTLDYSMSTTAFNLKQIVKKCFQYGVMPLISTITPRAGHRWTPLVQERTFDLNERITQLAQESNIILANNFAAFWDYPLSIFRWSAGTYCSLAR
jgi:lysophospholipase L1-like esterase